MADVFEQYADLYAAYLALVTGNSRQRVKIGTDSREIWMHKADAPLIRAELSRIGAMCWQIDPRRAAAEGVMQRAGAVTVRPFDLAPAYRL